MIKNKTVLHYKIGERNYNLEVEPDSPLGELHDALIAMRNFVIDKMKEIDQKKEEPKPCEKCE
jgi:hypothetical protein